MVVATNLLVTFLFLWGKEIKPCSMEGQGTHADRQFGQGDQKREERRISQGPTPTLWLPFCLLRWTVWSEGLH